MTKTDAILSVLCARHNPDQGFGETIKALIVRNVEVGRSYSDIAAEARCSPATVRNIYERWIALGTLDDEPVSGRSEEVTSQK
ncbi:hypothetical protein E4U56_007591 [Claviceps arundinis]|uniref:Uncharacterized protein n=1 Tax=Claviceps arundinis TaxID=1623583 RepID=A0A9P7MV13_9HYPO|nr:hypothetical protein E4U56_007591 [Claviceps arundinis]